MQVIVYSQNNGQVAVCYPTGEVPIEELLAKDCPAGAIIVDADSLPNEHNEFFNAWELNGTVVTLNLNKAKDIAHDKRRAARSAEFAPLDIKATIPSEAAAAEAARQAIRDKYAAMQAEMDSAATMDQLKNLLPG